MKKGCLILGLIIAWGVLVFPTTTPWGMKTGNKKNKNQAALKDLQLGIKNYQVEYHGYPRPNPSAQSSKPAPDQTFESEGDILLCLLGDKPDWNPRNIVFIEPPLAREVRAGLFNRSPPDKHGLINKDPAHPRLVDQWGHTFVILIDTNYDNKMVNPDASNTDPSIKADAPPNLIAGVAVFSRGKDGIAGTKDDIVSWRP